MVYADIRGGSLEGRQRTVRSSKTAIFSAIACYFVRSFRGKTNVHYYTVGPLFTSSSPFHWPQNACPWVTVKEHFTLNSLLFLSSSKFGLFTYTESAVISIYILGIWGRSHWVYLSNELRTKAYWFVLENWSHARRACTKRLDETKRSKTRDETPRSFGPRPRRDVRTSRDGLETQTTSLQNREIKYQRKFSLRLPIKGLVNASRTLGKRQIKMQRNFYIPKSQDFGMHKFPMQRKYVLQYRPFCF